MENNILGYDKILLTEKKTVDDFVDQFGCKLTIMNGGEHWFHTPEQMEVLEQWTKDSIPD